MKRFLLHILSFSGFCLALMVAIYMVNSFNFKTNSPELGDVRVLILGDSHAQFSMNPSMFDSALNVAQRAEPYALSFWKLNFLTQGKKLDTLILGFAPHNLAGFNDLKFVHDNWAHEMFMRAYPIKNYIFLEPLDISYQEYATVFLRQMLLKPRINHVHFMGKFPNSIKSNLKNVTKPINRHYFSVDYQITKTNEIYLDSILSYCKNQQIVPILVSPPVHKDYLQLIPKENMDYYYQKKQSIEASGVFVIDETATIYEDSLFFNYDHLNVYGANKFTELIKNRL